ncbi:MAG TPA: oxaloacetate decarboxylase, partial [Oceanospirillaceae bacterium]|nr:oxaloacetate decarboxylase [Oceanospirillaceae bacterium]
LTYALFPQVGLKFLENRNNPDAFEPVPTGEEVAPVAAPAVAGGDAAVYTINVNGQSYVVEVAEGGDISAVGLAPVAGAVSAAPLAAAPVGGEPVAAPLAG